MNRMGKMLCKIKYFQWFDVMAKVCPSFFLGLTFFFILSNKTSFNAKNTRFLVLMLQ